MTTKRAPFGAVIVAAAGARTAIVPDSTCPPSTVIALSTLYMARSPSAGASVKEYPGSTRISRYKVTAKVRTGDNNSNALPIRTRAVSGPGSVGGTGSHLDFLTRCDRATPFELVPCAVTALPCWVSSENGSAGQLQFSRFSNPFISAAISTSISLQEARLLPCLHGDSTRKRNRKMKARKPRNPSHQRSCQMRRDQQRKRRRTRPAPQRSR